MYIGAKRSVLLGSASVLPIWQYNFAVNNTLPSDGTVSVSSPSTGGLIIDANGYLTYKPNNLLTYSNTFTNAAWAKTNCAVSNPNAVADPFGGTNASTLTSSATNGYVSYTVSATSAMVMNSIWVRRRTGVGNIMMRKPDTTTPVIAVTSTWTQFTLSATGAALAFVLQFSATGDAIDIYGATQSYVTYETTPRPGDQVITNASVYYGPAFEYNKGLRIWESRINSALYSSSIPAATWPSVAATAVNAATTSPSGVMDGTSLTESTTNAAHYINNATAFTTVASTAYTYSVFVKAGTGRYITVTLNNGTGAAYAVFDLNNNAAVTQSGVAGTTYTFGSAGADIYPNGWYRLNVTGTTTGTSVTVMVATSNTGTYSVDTSGRNVYLGTGLVYYIWGMQFETATNVGPYIPTGSLAITAAADSVTLTGIPLTALQGANATVVVEAVAPYIAVTNTLVNINAGVYFFARLAFTKARSNMSATLTSNPTVNSASPNTNFRISSAIAPSSVKVSLNNGAIASGTGTSAVVTTVQLGQTAGSNFLNGCIRGMSVYDNMLSESLLSSKSIPGTDY